jgi:hypothetical protein
MVLKFFDKISECFARAAELRECANATSSPTRKTELLKLETQWLSVVESYKLVSRAGRFPIDGYTRRSEAAENRSSLADMLDVLVGTAIEQTEGKARAAFYLADPSGAELRHIIEMPQAYARYVDGFAISPQSLACGLATATGQPVVTADVNEEPRWKQWLWLARQFDYRACWSFPISTSSGQILGSFAMYYQQPRQATPRDLDFAAVLTRTAATIISRH